MSSLRRARPPETEVPSDPLDWRPQLPRPTRIAVAVEDPILEPHWSGLHVLAHFDAQRAGREGLDDPWLRLIDEQGEDATADEPAVIDELARSVMALDAVLDGYLTEQATRTGEGASVSLRANVSRMQPILPGRAEIDVRGGSEPEGSAVAFVAVDLLRLDGQVLFDVPLLERKRLLEAVVAPGELVRVSVYTRPPIGQWLVSWKSAGFEGLVAKGANSRYRPASLTEEWAVYTKLR